MRKVMFYSKSDGTTMLEHGEIIKNVTLELSKRILNDKMFNRYKDILTRASLLHDIGKVTTNFQNKLINKKIDKPSKYRHNEIGWAFLSQYYKDIRIDRELLLYLVFWHHGISNKLEDVNDLKILKDLSDDDIIKMKEYFISVIDKKYLSDEPLNELRNAPKYYDPKYYNNEYEEENFLYQWKILYGCLVSGDRIGSKLNKDSNIKEYIDNYLNLTNVYNPIKNWVYKNNERGKKQIEIINQCVKQTTQINAPAGFGKTNVGLLWGLKRNKKIIWVCPRNAVAISVYDTVIHELEKMNINPSVELILTGEIKKSNSFDINQHNELYQSDIIITNIDNYLAPSNNNSLLEYYSLINGCSVIFDEYHELITDSALFFAFILMMKGRNIITNSETLLLSATPNIINNLWENETCKTLILPEPNKHYPAQHNKKFIFRAYSSNNFNFLVNEKKLVIFNSIPNAQEEKRNNNNYSLLFHSKYIDEVREEKLAYLLENHGENNNNVNNVVGTHLLQAGLNISFENVYESCLSPDSTLQRLGRNNRWGCMNNPQFDSVLLKKNKSDLTMVGILYHEELRDKWFNIIKEYDGASLTLNDFYEIYDKFYLDNKTSINIYNKNLLNESFKNISKIYPFKFIDKYKKETKTFKADSNKLRSNGNEIFYIVKNVKDNNWSGIFSEEVIGGFDRHFNENSYTLQNIKKVMRILRDDDRFNYTDKPMTLDEIRRQAKKSDTPYIRFDKVYDEDLGVISIKDL